jgi:ABC-type sugar transport system ATPase subunit
MTELPERKPAHLSGGQRQRRAIGRHVFGLRDC